MIDLSEAMQREMVRIANNAAPHEAVGLILNGTQIVQMFNHSTSPHNSFLVKKEQILERVKNSSLQDAVLWHSHPSGGVGPSRVDMQQRTKLLHHLVVSLTENGPVFSWY